MKVSGVVINNFTSHFASDFTCAPRVVRTLATLTCNNPIAGQPDSWIPLTTPSPAKTGQGRVRVSAFFRCRRSLLGDRVGSHSARIVQSGAVLPHFRAACRSVRRRRHQWQFQHRRVSCVVVKTNVCNPGIVRGFVLNGFAAVVVPLEVWRGRHQRQPQAASFCKASRNN
jgi:hypothetical protein